MLQSRRDAVIQSETGSGKTMSFLMPVLSQLDYPPQPPLSEFQARGIPCMDPLESTHTGLLYDHHLVAAVAGQPVCLPRGSCTGCRTVQCSEWPF